MLTDPLLMTVSLNLTLSKDYFTTPACVYELCCLLLHFTITPWAQEKCLKIKYLKNCQMNEYNEMKFSKLQQWFTQIGQSQCKLNLNTGSSSLHRI